MTDYKQLCAELLNAYEHELNKRGMGCDLINRARAALAQPEPEGPSDEELTQFLFESFKGPIEFLCDAEEEAHLMIRSHVKFARAVLARWGRPVAEKSSAAQPADGEVAELANSLRHSGDALRVYGLHGGADDCHRAADLLERLSPPQPIPVSERLPGPELCWWFTPESDKEYGWWVLEPDGMEREPQPTHWLPAHALPVP
jgi:hypothetical protein